MVYNDLGYSSGEIVTAVTMAGVPHHPPSLSAHAINHTAVQVNWTQPCKITLSLKPTHTHTHTPSRKRSSMVLYSMKIVLWQFTESENRDSKLCFFSCPLTLCVFLSSARPSGRGGIILSDNSVSSVKSNVGSPSWDHLHSDRWPLAQYYISCVITRIQRST